ncbi:unnamed protein product [Paramecium sonneborni]|uniref:Transmembrane protein n=1 Tax=Paramecium sonneborni TaxID=65129 RepID=A0A8S1KQT6_9CILI|nr:unnamed protein product [Paramecium sonneborni]
MNNLFTLLFLIEIISGAEQCYCSNFTQPQYCNQFQQCNWNGKNCYESNCTEIQTSSKCIAPQCAWYLDKCHDGQQCNYYTNKQICNQVFGCVANDGYCLPYEDCSFQTQDKCNGITPTGIQCFWNSQTQNCIKFQTCNRLSLDNNDCNSIPFCIQKKKQCENFNNLECSDMESQYECSRMASYECSWQNGKCSYTPCSTYTTSSSCSINSCTWNGSSCLYCPIDNSYSISFIIINLFILAVLF